MFYKKLRAPKAQYEKNLDFTGILGAIYTALNEDIISFNRFTPSYRYKKDIHPKGWISKVKIVDKKRCFGFQAGIEHSHNRIIGNTKDQQSKICWPFSLHKGYARCIYIAGRWRNFSKTSDRLFYFWKEGVSND